MDNLSPINANNFKNYDQESIKKGLPGLTSSAFTSNHGSPMNNNIKVASMKHSPREGTPNIEMKNLIRDRRLSFYNGNMLYPGTNNNALGDVKGRSKSSNGHNIVNNYLTNHPITIQANKINNLNLNNSPTHSVIEQSVSLDYGNQNNIKNNGEFIQSKKPQKIN